MMVYATGIVICWLLAAICNAVMDVLAFKYKYSVFSKMDSSYWNPSISWRNKYKNKKKDDGPAFFGSTTFLVFTTDAWHFFQFLSGSFIVVSLIISLNVFYSFEWFQNIALFTAFKVIWGIVFEVFYAGIFRSRR